MDIAAWLALLAVPAGILALLVAVLCDLGWRLIPNALPATLAAAGVALRLAEGLGALLVATVTFALALLLLGLLWRLGFLGGGDAKLGAAGSVFLTPAAVPQAALATALAGGVLALLYLALRPLLPPHLAPAGRTRPILVRLSRVEAWRVRRGSLPYAVAIAAGVLTATA
jgi:prepilin peptidase CpaA